MIDLEAVAVALDAFPDWDENMRAEVFHAIDVAPENILSPEDEDDYFRSEAHAAWERIRVFPHEHSESRWPVTLDESSGGEAAPTKEEILKALHRGARMIG